MSDISEKVISESIDYIVAHWQDQPDLDHLARRAGYEPTHFQKVFTRMVGVSPKKLNQYMNARHARDLLLEGYSTLEAAYSTGLSGNGRLFDLMVNVEAATPGEVQKRGRGLCICYGFHPSPMGDMLIAETGRGICWLGFVVDEDRNVPLQRLLKYWPLADFSENESDTRQTAERMLDIWRGKRSPKLDIHLYGTNFQIQVWRALLKIPCGGAVSYQDVASYLGKPKASRAVGGAVGANPISLLIPCHRVIQSTGIIENYGWGTPRKKLILALEAQNIAH
ncbi:MAG: methylated-DNA--[protein]-cysteine S-methyltransferase [Micavibrio aeruginosavorus]|uniref:methylated-DNA--[protein]-cysteine S-methyltransferase n=1 Tax=Micavibrio aeruginosavorus TaxID=349221 RepID=A0A7T5R3Y4_9BACT|nr:MAG: methylated-DNA--[protein]-cysteine S-methyltransferase [Micavibrio aeruginosavorus]